MWMADPHVISALRAKRAELSGELIAAEQRIVQLRSDIASLDGAIRVFDPSAVPDKIRPILRRKKPTLIPRGQCSRAVLDALRDCQYRVDGSRDRRQLAVRYQLDTGDRDAMKALTAKVRNTLTRQKGLTSE